MFLSNMDHKVCIHTNYSETLTTFVMFYSSMNYLIVRLPHTKVLPHSWHLYSFFWTLTVKDQHISHLDDVSHLWIFWCLVRFEAWVKDFSHSKHLKGISTKCTVRWLVRCDFQLKHLPHVIFVRFLSCVYSPMKLKMCFLTKGFSTLITFVWFLSSMNSLMLCKVCLFTKVLSTLITVIGFLSLWDLKGCCWTKRRWDSWPLEEKNSIRGETRGLITQSFCVIKFY